MKSAIYLQVRHKWILTASLLFVACVPPCPRAWSPIMPEGRWNIRGLGELSECPNADYNTDSFRLNAQTLLVDRQENDLSSAHETWRAGTFNPNTRQVIFSVQETSPIGVLTFDFDGYVQWRDSEMTIAGNFEVSGSCQGRGVFVTEIEPRVKPMLTDTCEWVPPEVPPEPPPTPVDEGVVPDLTLDLTPPEVDMMEVDMMTSPTGMCVDEVEAGELDRSTLQTRLPELGSCVSFECVIGLEDRSECVRCVRESLNISEPCSECIYDIIECLSESCLSECLSASDTEASCRECSEARCGAQEERCFGQESHTSPVDAGVSLDTGMRLDAGIDQGLDAELDMELDAGDLLDSTLLDSTPPEP